jgi:hypothetical protein
LTEPHLELQRGKIVGLAQPDALGLPLAGQDLLRQWRSVVGHFPLGTHQRDATGEAFLAEGLTCSQTCQGAADDHHMFHPAERIDAIPARRIRSTIVVARHDMTNTTRRVR